MTDELDFDAAKEWVRTKLSPAVEGGLTQRAFGLHFRAWELRCRAYNYQSTAQRIIVLAKRGVDFGELFRPQDIGDEPEFTLDEGFAKGLIKDAEGGDAAAHQAVCDIISHHINDEKRLPEFLHDYLAEVLANQTSPWWKNGRGWDPDDYCLRDQLIRQCVGILVAKHGLGRTRNTATAKPSACSLVAEVLNELGQKISEKRVEAITKN